MNHSIRSMTGFGKAEFEIGNSKFRIEIRSVNHRFLDLKIRVPREFQSLEHSIRALVQSCSHRGSLDLKLERSNLDSAAHPPTEPAFEVNEARAREAVIAYHQVAKILGSDDKPSMRDIVSFPEVIQSRSTNEFNLNVLWKEKFEPSITEALHQLKKMREVEGTSLSKLLLESTKTLRNSLETLSSLREQSSNSMRQKTLDRVREVFETIPFPSGSPTNLTQSLLESRVAQEVALLLDRTDIQEELDRFQGHLNHFEKTLLEGGTLGRKLEFILQELGREINTLGNKAQEFSISEQVVAIKVRLEQLREQALNLE